MIVGPNCVVGIYYTLTNQDGEVMDECNEGEPLTYLHGAAGIIPGLEKELAGKTAGDDFNVTISPEDAYGPHREEMVQDVPRASFPPEIEIEPGMQFSAQASNGQQLMVRVTRIEGDLVTVDGNHPLAGATLHFAGRIDLVRAATQEELAHGHVH